MGAPGGGGGGSGFDYTMGGRSYTDNDNRVVVGYLNEKDAMTGPYNMSNNSAPVFQSMADYNKNSRIVDDTIRTGGYDALKNLVNKDPYAYYDISKTILLGYTSPESHQSYKNLYSNLGDLNRETAFGQDSIFSNFSAARDASQKPAASSSAPSGTGPAVPAPRQTGGLDTPEALLTDSQKEERRRKELTPDSGNLLLGTTTLLGG